MYGASTGLSANGASATSGIQHSSATSNFLQRSYQQAVLTSNNGALFALFADLSISQTGPSTAVVGTPISYTYTVANNGPGDGFANVFSSRPPHTTLVGCQQVSGPHFNLTCDSFTQQMFGPLHPGESTVLRVTIFINSDTPNGTTLMNTATVGSSFDPVSSNNSSTLTTTVASQADLGITKTAPAGPIPPGQNVTYTLGVTNSGPSDAANVTLADPLPTGTTFVSATQTAGPSFTCTNPAVGSAGTVSCNLASLVANASASFQVVVRVNTTGTAGATLANTATISSAATDPSPGNNTATTTTAVLGANLALTNSGSPDPSVQGQNVTYTLTLAAGRLQSTIRARNSGCSPNDQLVSLHFIRTDNATVDVLGTTGRGGDFTVAVPPGTAQVTLTVNRVTAGQPATVQLVVTDGCGAWPTFVGGGAGAF